MNTKSDLLGVSEVTILREWGVGFGTLNVRLRSELPATEAVERLREAWAAVQRPPSYYTGLGGVAATAKGPVLTVHGVRKRKDAADVLHQVAGNLRDMGVAGRLASCAFQASPVNNPLLPFDCVSAGISLRGRESYTYHEPETRWARLEYHWIIEPEVLQTVMDLALDWCAVPSGKHFITSFPAQFKCAADERAGLLRTAYGSVPAAGVVCAAGPDEVRRVAFLDDGFLIFERRSLKEGWDAAVQDLTGVLASFADLAEYGLIKRSRVPCWGWNDLLDQQWPQRPHLGPEPTWGRALMTGAVPDAFGVQLLSATHRPDLLTGWQATPAGTSSTLLTHPDLPAWFDGPLPEPGVLQAGRESLSHLLMTDAMVREKKDEYFGRN